MTLQNGLLHGKRAYLWTDTAYWNGDTGDFLCFGSKAFKGLAWPFAGVLSTWGGNPHQIAIDIGNEEPKDLDGLLSASIAALWTFAANGGGGRVLLASYSDQPRLHIVGCHELFPGSGYGPFEPVEIDHLACSGNETKAYRDAVANGFTPRRMRALIDAQIATPFAGEGKLAALGPRVWIGGNVVRLEVGADGVSETVERAVDMGDRAS